MEIEDEIPNLSFDTKLQKQFETPQEKKRLSYAKDCRNSYGESRAQSRFSIRRNKANSNRKLRRAAVQVLQVETKSNDLESSDLLQKTVRKFTRLKWRKCADVSLGEWVKNRFEYRQRMFRARLKRQAKREEDK